MMSCSVERLQSALAGSLLLDDEAALCLHLDECDACGAEMERLAASAEVRAETVAHLADDEWDADVPTRDDWSPADFTVEHLDPSDEPNVLGRLGGYDVLEIVGRGGMGVVLKAFDRELKRCIAIKVLAPHLAQSSLARKRFAREARAAAAVVHPNVLAIHHVQPSGRLPFLVMPLVAGESLAQRIASQGTLSLEETLRIGMQAAAGLAAAHEQGLVHRDVKPANILLEKGVERAVLMDFGLARAADDVTLTRRGIISGTPQYMSPEQARGEPLDGRSDLFSLGCVLYEMATGVSPFRTDSMLATLRRLVDDAPRPLTSLNPELPSWFVAITNRLLEKDPARRFGSAKEVSEALEACLAHLQQPGVHPLPRALATSNSVSGRRRIGVRGALTMLAGLAVALFGGFMIVSSEPDIAGTWSGEDWGAVVLKKSESGQYDGTYTDTFGKTPGAIRLTWSRIERRFNGTWREGDDRFGNVSVRLVGNEIRGAFTTDTKAKINPATPRLSDLTWVRAKGAANRTGQVPPGIAMDEQGDVYSVNLSHAAPPMFWGPIIERTILGDGRDCWALNLATGKVVTSNPSRALDFRVGASDVLRAAKVDLYSPIEANTSDTLLALDMRLVPLGAAPDDWDMSASEAIAHLDKSASLTVRKSETFINGRKVFAFRTRDGATGLLRISESREDAQRVKTFVRYKLVQKGPPTVELIALAKYPTEGSPWWTPEGRLLKESPVDPSSLDLRVAEAPDKNWYAAVFRIPGGLDSVVGGDAIRGSGVPSIWMGRQTRHAKPVDDLAAVALALPASATQANLAVQVARGTWQTIATVDGKRVRDQDSNTEGGTEWKVMDRKDRLRLFVDYPRADVQIRVAFLRGGGMTFARLLHAASPNDAALRVEAQFPGLVDLSGDCSFIVQTRAYENFEFPRVALSGKLEPASSRWGDPVNGLTVRLRADKNQLRADIRNDGPLSLATSTDDHYWHLEVDGVWYRGASSVSPLVALDANHPLDDLPVRLDWTWKTAHVHETSGAAYGGGGAPIPKYFVSVPLESNLKPGKHTVRLAVVAMSMRAGGPTVVRAVSPPVEIDMGRPVAAPTEELLATREQVAKIEALLKTVPVTTAFLAELFEATPGVPGEYRMRSDVVRIPIRSAEKARLDFVPFGEVLLRKGGSTYIQWDFPLGQSSHHYYGPIHGNAFESIGVKRRSLDGKAKDSIPPAKSSFGPVLESVVPFSVCGTQYYFQFSGNRILFLGYGQAATKERAEEDDRRAAAAGGKRSNHCYLDGWSVSDAKWVEAAGGIDALVLPGKGEDRLQFIGQGCVFTNEDEPEWDRLTAEDTLRRLRTAKDIVSRFESKKSELPATYLFKTARGDVGILQLLGVAEDERGSMRLGVRLRCKLIQRVADARPEANKAAK